MRVTIVGCSGSLPGPDSPASCYLVEADGFRLVLDLGNGAVGALQRYSGLDQVDAILLSHLHADHCLDMVGYSVFQTYHPDGPRPKITVYGPAGSADRLERAVAGHASRMTDAFDFVTLEPGVLQAGPLRITAARMRHTVETFGVRIEHEAACMAYSADTGPCPELVALASGADLLLAEATFGALDDTDLPADLHLTARQAAQHAASAGARELVLTHLAPWSDPQASLEAAAAAFAGPLRLAGSGQTLLA